MKHCFFCNNEINDESNNSLLTYRLCNACKQEMDKGNTLVVIQTDPVFENQGCICHLSVPDPENPESTRLIPAYPTGEWAVFDDNTINEFFDATRATQIISNKIGLIMEDAFNEIKDIYKNTKLKTEEQDNEKENN